MPNIPLNEPTRQPLDKPEPYAWTVIDEVTRPLQTASPSPIYALRQVNHRRLAGAWDEV